MHQSKARDEIRIENLEVYAFHGVYPAERKNGQTFYVNAILYTDTRPAGKADDLNLSTNYGEVCNFIYDWMKKNTHLLIEAVAEQLAKDILLKYDLINSIDLEIRKPEAPIEHPFESVSVKIHRGWNRCFIALGSNIGDRRKYLEDAVNELRNHPAINVGKISTFLETKPYGYVEQDVFLNGAVEIETLLNPYELLEVLHTIEAEADRKREIHWGPRTLDLDILFYGDEIIETEQLTVPHADMANREFVLAPLNEIAPGVIHPVYNTTVSVMLEKLRRQDKRNQQGGELIQL